MGPTTSATSGPSKAEWRIQFRRYRDGLSSANRAARSALICSRALGLPAVARASTVHTYWPQANSGEVDTRGFIGALRGRGATLVLPVVTRYDSPTMEHRRYDGPASLTTSRWGIPEPTGGRKMNPSSFDAVIVPALGVDQRGHRIGQGGGYYDAFLSSISVPRIAFVYDACVVPSVPVASHDEPVTTIVTERRIIQPSRS